MVHNQSTQGLYNPGDILWNIHSEMLIGAAGPRALLLELAHPLVAEGVAQHSNFKRNPFGRLIRTGRVMHLLTFGTGEHASIAARHTNQCHTRVHGETADGTPYDAGDPQLRLWVFATLIDSILLAHEDFVGPLTMQEKESYYQQSKRMARCLGVPESVMPENYTDFTRYMDDMLTGDTLKVSDNGRMILRSLLIHPLSAPLAWPGMFVAAARLPEHLREGFGIGWGDGRERLLELMMRLSRGLRRRLPDFMFIQPTRLVTRYMQIGADRFAPSR
jgi:uncharacterized protein (DUF2236 family)